ncbi:BA75_03450T0 [Komagataella pastoris]|uniref:BA75_03450T0 n=1 Tax=Komagataella pastoris TaxID=4922 RepID=A0A1B2JF75_PICPA|nr:BA75_03450T0 [Komagataella pastoris]
MSDANQPSSSLSGPSETISSTLSSTGTATNSSNSDSTGDSYNIFVGAKPSTVLFFIALTVGACIALLFLFFTLRYFVRSRLGLYVPSQSYSMRPTFVEGRNGNRFAVFPSTIQQQLIFSGRRNFTMAPSQQGALPGSFGPYGPYGITYRRRRYKKRKMTTDEVQKLFPIKTYGDWLNGGKEEDERNRDETMIIHENSSDTSSVILDNDEELSTPNGSNRVQDQNQNQENFLPMPKEIDLGMPDEKDELHFDSGTCAICIDTLEEDELVRGLICGHVFHADCLDPWLTTRRACCPMCKRNYYMKDGNIQSSQDADDDDNNSLTNNNINDSSGLDPYSSLYIPRTVGYRGQLLLSVIEYLRQNQRLQDTVPESPIAIPNNNITELIGSPPQDTAANMPTSTNSSPDNTHGNEIPAPGIPNSANNNNALNYLADAYNNSDLYNLQEEATNRTNKWWRFIFVLFWRSLGVKKHDLYLYFVVRTYEERRIARLAAEDQAGSASNGQERTATEGPLNLLNNTVDRAARIV